MARPEGHERSAKRVEMAERRNRVAKLHVLGGFTQQQIADVVGVSVQTISTDLRFIINMWLEDAKAAIAELRARELGELRQMELEAGQQYLKHKRPIWLNQILKIKERKAKMLALDVPRTVRTELELSVRPPDPLATKLANLSLEELSRVIELAGSDPQKLLEAGEDHGS